MKSCEHTCVDQCHAPYPCKEDRPCQSKTFVTCPCQRRKQEVRCQATRFNPWPNKDTILKCDDECARLQRNQRLAAALNVDPESHKDEHIPYSDKTLKMFRENITWAQTQERAFRVFATSADEKRLRFKPMPPHQRAFLHSLAEDYGLDSESQDPEGHRHVCIFKTPRFVAAPQKTLGQCVRLIQAQKPALVALPDSRKEAEAFNALLLISPRFGVTIEEVEKELSKDIAAASRSGPSVTFSTHFLPSDEILIKAVPTTTAATVLTTTPQAVESVLKDLKSSVSKSIQRNSLAANVILCHAGDMNNITRKETGAPESNTGGWNAVASRGAKRAPAVVSKVPAGGSKTTLGLAGRSGGAFVALRRLELKKKKEEAGKVVVEDDWEKALEKEEQAEASGSGGEGSGKEEEKEVVTSDGEGEGKADTNSADIEEDEGR